MNFKGIDKDKIDAITKIKGPVLIIAGPGTGKTFTLEQRTVYMVQEGGVRPEQILITTFTEKAAKEIITRITRAFAKNNISANINEMYIGTFHSICLRILKENIEYTRLGNNYRVMEGFDQQYTIYQHIWDFHQIPGFASVIDSKQWWQQAKDICKLVNELVEEMVDVDKLVEDNEDRFKTVAMIIRKYQDILREGNLMDFSSIQTEAYRLLSEHPEVLSKIQDKISYLMIDEYQDTNYIQEQLVMLLGSRYKNICVVGDDDQGLYRFRGATIRNILTFKDTIQKHFPGVNCQQVNLVTNFRSNKGIIDFYNSWMCNTHRQVVDFEWKNGKDKYRYDKVIVPDPEKALNLESATVVKLVSDGKLGNWYKKVADFILKLKNTGKITDYNQVAFLFRSVSGKRVQNLANELESKGISVYSPRSNMFFYREEIRIFIGCLLLMFPSFLDKYRCGEYELYSKDVDKVYNDCLEIGQEFLEENIDLKKWVKEKAKLHKNLKKNLDYSFKSLIYQMMEFPCFHEILEIDMSSGVVDMRPLRNLAILTQIIGQFEYLERIDVLTSANIEKKSEKLFKDYLRLQIIEKLNEYEDDVEYAPSGCVSFMTIHQSKGLQFPIVFVAPMQQKPEEIERGLADEIKEKYAREEYEPMECIPYFDFWRLFYTAFSRPKNLLVLTAPGSKSMPQQVFKEVFNSLPDITSKRFNLQALTFANVEPNDLKATFSFTSHISVYQTCPMQYKFFKELGFAPRRVGSRLYGTIIHATIEEIHKAVLRGEKHLITATQVQKWFAETYDNIMKAERSYLKKETQNALLKQVQEYVNKRKGNWDDIREAEYDVSLVKDDYIIDGKIDLIEGKNNTVEIVDFKSSAYPDLIKDKESIERYRNQLQVYSHLVEERSNHQLQVSKMHLYYTGTSADKNPWLSFDYNEQEVDSTMAEFDSVVHKIMKKDFEHMSNNKHTCNECDFRYYCKSKS